MTRFDAIELLSASRDALQCRAGRLSPVAGGYLWTAIDYISDELDQLVARDLTDDGTYDPTTDAFNARTDRGSRFVGILDDIRCGLSTDDPVARSVAALLKLIPKSGHVLALQTAQASFWDER